jgi:ribosomal protein L14
LIIRNRYAIQKTDGGVLNFKANNIILLKKKQDVKSKYLFGPVCLKMKRKKFLTLFSVIF